MHKDCTQRKNTGYCRKYGAKFFDFSALLSIEAEPEKAVYGGHPNGEGGTVVADAFVKQFGSMFE